MPTTTTWWRGLRVTVGPWDFGEFDPDQLDVERVNRALLRRWRPREDRAPLSGRPSEDDTPFVVAVREEDSGYQARSRERTGDDFAPDRTQTGWGPALRSLVERMYPGSRVEFGTYLEAADLDRPVLFEAEAAARVVRAYVWLMERSARRV
jgi:hypothetical protein